MNGNRIPGWLIQSIIGLVITAMAFLATSQYNGLLQRIGSDEAQITMLAGALKTETDQQVTQEQQISSLRLMVDTLNQRGSQADEVRLNNIENMLGVVQSRQSINEARITRLEQPGRLP